MSHCWLRGYFETSRMAHKSSRLNRMVHADIRAPFFVLDKNFHDFILINMTMGETCYKPPVPTPSRFQNISMANLPKPADRVGKPGLRLTSLNEKGVRVTSSAAAM